jgi:putative hemolysin
MEAFFAGTEMSIISGNKLKMRYLAKKGNKAAQKIETLLKKPQLFLSTTLVGVNLGIIIASTLASRLISQWAPAHLVNVYTTFIMLPLILFFGEIIPMTIGRTYSTKLSLILIYPLSLAYYVLYPVIRLFSLISEQIAGLFKLNRQHKNPFLTREELMFILEDEIKRGSESEYEKEIIKKIFQFQDITVDDIMIPLNKVICVEASTPCKTVIELMHTSGFSRLPVYEGNPENMIGIIRTNKLLRAEYDKPVRKYIFKPYTAMQSTPIRNILWDLQLNGRQMVIVHDTQNKAVGMVTLEDIMERVVGSIMDEYDTVPENYQHE